MRLTRPAVAVAVGVSLVLAGSAGAAVKKKVPPVCNIVTDDADDASVVGPDPSDASLDILSADIASDAKTFSAVLRLKDMAATSVAEQTGRNYYMQIEVPGGAFPIYFSYEVDGLGETFNWGDLEPAAGGVNTYTPKGEAAGILDASKNEIRISVPVADIAAVGSVKPGVKITTVHASTTAVLGVLVSDVDSADGTKTYVAGAKSCVTPGK